MTELNNHHNSITFTKNGVPYSTHFDDIYFDSKTGFSQSQQVFIEGSQLKEKLLTARENKKSKLTIAETGFGTGLNFLLTLRTYFLLEQALKQQNKIQNKAQNKGLPLPKIHFISVEKYPLTKPQLVQALVLFPELKQYAQLLLTQYPETPKEKCQFSFFNDKITLTLIIDDATQALTNLYPAPKPPHYGCPNKALVDIWFLDGFSPEKNPQMWSQDLFTQMARLSTQQATLATFTVAGFVRRGLSEVGFRVQKQAASGQKKEILVGIFQTPQYGKGYQVRPKITKPQQVTIIGGGIASACAALALTKQGIKVVLYCKDNEIAQGASSNAIGALFPLIHQHKDDISLFYQQAFWRAKELYQEVAQQGFKFSHDWCGLLDLAFNKKAQSFQEKFLQLKSWPKELLHSVDSKIATSIANLPLKNGGLFFPHAGWIAPQELVQQIFHLAKQTGRLRIKCNVNVTAINQNDDKAWQLKTNKGDINAKILLLCGGAEAIKINILQQSSLVAIRGQVSSMQPNEQSKKLNTVICHKGYLTPQHNEQHCIGATFERDTFDTMPKEEEDNYNLAMLEQSMPNLLNWQLNDVIGSKARLRCATPDHFPMVGIMPDVEQHKVVYAHLAKDKKFNIHTPTPYLENLYVLTGLGARGLCSAPLLADIVTADLCGLPYPVNYKMLYNLAPNRFIIKDIIRQKN